MLLSDEQPRARWEWHHDVEPHTRLLLDRHGQYAPRGLLAHAELSGAAEGVRNGWLPLEQGRSGHGWPVPSYPGQLARPEVVVLVQQCLVKAPLGGVGDLDL